MEKVKPNLIGPSESLLISLWTRTKVFQDDQKAKEIIDNIDYDFSRFEKWEKLIRITIPKTDIVDIKASSFIKKHPYGVIINIGAGLDTRFFRLDNGTIIWYEIDIKDAIELRKQFFQETKRYKFITASVADDRWVDQIKEEDKPILFIADSVLMFIEEKDVKHFFSLIIENFLQAEIVFEIIGPLIKKIKLPLIQATKGKPSFKWLIWNIHDLEEWDHRLKVIYIRKNSDSFLSFISSTISGNKIVHAQVIS
jgi:O-methyltransferase involved in polyketide biosynthesis